MASSQEKTASTASAPEAPRSGLPGQRSPPRRPNGQRLWAALFGLIVLGLLVWGYGWQAPTATGQAEQSVVQRALSPIPSPKIADLPVVRAGPDGGFVPRGLCGPAAGCERIGGETLFLPRTDRGPRFLAQMIHEPESGQALAMTLDGGVFRAVQDDATVNWAQVTPGFQAEGIETSPARELSGHEGEVFSVAVSPDGTRIVSAGGDGTIRLWDAATWAQIGDPLHGHGDAVLSVSVAFSPENTRIISGGGDGTIRLWDAVSGAQIGDPLHGHGGGVYSVAFSPDDTRIISGGGDSMIRLWDAASGAQIGDPLYGHGGGVYSVAFSPDGTRIISGGGDGTIRLWDSATWAQIGGPLYGHEGAVMSVAFSPDGTRIVSGGGEWGGDGTIRLWDAASGAQIGDPLYGHDDRVFSVAFSPDGTRIISGGGGGTIRLWDLVGEARPTAIAFDGPDRVIGAGPGGLLEALDLTADWPEWERLQIVGEAEAGGDGLYGGASSGNGGDDLHAVHVAPDGRVLVASDDGTILVSDDPADDNWTRQHDQPGLRITALHVTDDGAAWAAGQANGRPVWLHAADAADGNWTILRHLPAPWWFALLGFGLPLAIHVNARAWRDTGPRIEESIADRAVNDLPLDWSGVDALDLKPLARSLSHFLRNTDTKPPLTVAVTGRWGSGKSSLMNLLHLDLRHEGASTVWFNAWHHRSEDHLFAALMEAIRSEGVPSAWTLQGFGFRLRLALRRSRRELAALSMLAVTSVLALIFFAVGSWLAGRDMAETIVTFRVLAEAAPETVTYWLPGDWAETWAGTPFLSLLFAALMAIAGLWIWVKKTIPFPVKPAALLSEIAGRTSVSRFTDRLSFRHHFGNALGEVATVLRRPTSAGLVIFIDDLDRCHPDHVLNVLEAVNFVVSEGPCIVVLGMDREQVEHAVGLAFARVAEGLPDSELGLTNPEVEDGGTNTNEEAQKARRRKAYAQRYMEKLVNLEIAIPAMKASSVGLMVGVDRGDNGQQGAPSDLQEYDPGLWHRRLLPFWTRLRPPSLPVVIAFLLASLMVLSPVPQMPSPEPGETVSTEPVDTSATPPAGPDPTDAPSDEPTAPDPAPSVDIPVPASLALPDESQPDAAPAWIYWTTSVIILVMLLWLVAARLFSVRQDIRQDSAQFKQALGIVEPLLARTGVTPREIRRWENRMRFLAERLRAPEHKPDSLERVLRFIDKTLGMRLTWPEPEKQTPALPEPTLIALGAIEFADPELIRSEETACLSERLDVLGIAKNKFVESFGSDKDGLWPDSQAVRRYRQLIRGT